MKSSCLRRQTRILIIIPIALLLFTAMAPPAAAVPITWNVSAEILPYDWHPVGPKLQPEGTLSGWFTYDPSNPYSVGNWSIIAAINPLQAPAGLKNPFLFNPSNSVAGFYESATVNWFSFRDTASGSFVHLCGGNLVSPNLYGLYSYPGAEGSVFVAHNPLYIGWLTGQLTPTSVPEPSTLLLLGAGIVGLIGFRKKVRRSV